MLPFTVILLACTSISALAIPTTTTSNPLLDLDAAAENYARSVGNLPGKLNCDLSSASMPVAPTPLPSLPADQTLSAVVIGRGTQNYTCDTSNPASAPVPAGAVASLFDASCIAASVPDLLHMIPNIALQYPVPSKESLNIANLMLAGNHYFLDSKTPYFNLDNQRHSYGVCAAQKANESSPPANAPKGPRGQGNGSVAWLRLTAKENGYSFVNSFKTIYRLNTAGGSPPKTCDGMSQAFQVDYAAEYWLWG